MTQKEKQLLAKELATHLNTHDKAWMFFKISFPDRLGNMNLEGTPVTRAWEIVSEFEKNCMLGSISAHMNSIFDCNITLAKDF